VILKLPNVLSIKGLVTKFLPHNLHVLAYRYFYGVKDAGKNDTAPFETYLRFSISAHAIRKLCAQDGLQPAFFATYDVSSFHWLQKKKKAHFLYASLKQLFHFLSFGIIGDSELVCVFRKIEGRTESVGNSNVDNSKTIHRKLFQIEKTLS
jgi:hypothetical protein